MLWGIGVWLCGWGWLGDWVSYSHWVTRVAADIDRQNAISWIGFFAAIGGTESSFAAVLGIIFAGTTTVTTCRVWWRRGRQGDLDSQMSIAICCILLIPPHAFYYDAGLIVSPGSCFSHTNGNTNWKLLREDAGFLQKHGDIGTIDFIQYWSAHELLVSGQNPFNPAVLYGVERAEGMSD